MSYPILYNATEMDFGHLGLGVLKDTIDCKVVEEINGRFELEMTYPLAGIHLEYIKYDNLIKVDAGHASFSKNQLFRIERIDKKANGMITVYANHVSYQARGLVLEPEVQITNQAATQALETWRRSIIGSHPFEVRSDIDQRHSTKLSIQTHQNAWQSLGAILETWGGEYIFDNHRIDLRSERGGRANTLISYGRNLTDLIQEENITSTFTSIYPYAIYRDGDDERIVTLSNQLVMDSENAKYFAHRRVLPVDFSREFERDEQMTPARLRQLAEAYIEEHEIGVPRVSISLEFVDLTKSLNQSGLTYEQVNLCDMIPVRFEKLGIDTVAKVTRVIWDVLLDQYDSLEIGESRATLSDTIRSIERDVNTANNNTNSALTAANGKNSIFFGSNEPTPPIRVGDLWYRPNGEHTELWMWDGNGWKFIMSTAPDEVLLAEIEENRQIIAESNERVEQAQREIERILKEFEEQREKVLGMASGLDTLDRELEANREALEQANFRIDEALAASNGRNTIFRGSVEPTANGEGDLWYRPNGEHTELWIWNGLVWEFVMTTSPDENLRQQLEANRKIIEESNDRIVQSERKIERALTELESQSEKMIGMSTMLDTLDDALDTNREAISDANNRITNSLGRIYEMSREMGTLGTNLAQNQRDVETALAQAGEALTGTIHGDRIIANTVLGNRLQAGTVTGDRIAGRTITANQLMVADMTNHATIDERIGVQTNVPSTTWGGTRFTANTAGGSIGGNAPEIQKLVATQQFLPFCERTPNAFKNNDEVFYSFDIWCSASRPMNFTSSRFTVDSGNGTLLNESFTTTADAWLTVSGTMRLANAAWNTSTFYVFGINDATATGRVQIAVRNVIVRRRNGGELIVDGTIQGNHIDANAITARQIAASTITANEIAAGTITGDRIAGRTITANQLMVADMTNHATVNERIGAQTNVPTTTWGGTRFTANTAGGSIGGNTPEIQKMNETQQFLPFCARTPNAFRNNDEVFYSFDIWCSASRSMNFTSSRFTADSGNGTLLNAPFTTTAGAWLTVSGTMRLANTAWNTSTFYVFGVNDAIATGRVQIAVRNVIVRRRNSGELIVDGTIQGNHIDANAITARQIAAGAITATEIAAGAITADKIRARAITADHLAVGAITADIITTGQLNAARVNIINLNAESITTGFLSAARLQAGTITANHIATNTITSNQIAAGAITGDRIAGRTITANQLNVADMTNHATINERIGAQTNVPSATWGGTRFTANTAGGSISGNNPEMQKLVATQQFLPFCARTPNAFRHNEEVFYSFDIWCSASRPMSFVAGRFTSDSGNGTLNTASFTTTAGIWLTVSGTLRLNATAWNTSSFYAFGVSDASATGRVQIAVRNVIVRRRNGGELIVDGTIRGNHIVADAITAREIATGTITANQIAAGTITADRIRTGAITADMITAGSMSAARITTGTLNATNVNIINLNASNISTGTLSAARIGANTITATHIAAGAITADMITAGSMSAARITTGTLNASNVNVTNLNASNITTGTLSAARIGANTITAAHIATGAITASMITTGSMSAARITTGTLNASNVNVTNLNASNITTGTLSAARIGANTITATHIATGAITASMITTGSMSAARITTGTMHGDRIQAGTLNANRITAGVMSADRISGGTINSSIFQAILQNWQIDVRGSRSFPATNGFTAGSSPAIWLVGGAQSNLSQPFNASISVSSWSSGGQGIMRFRGNSIFEDTLWIRTGNTNLNVTNQLTTLRALQGLGTVRIPQNINSSGAITSWFTITL